MVEESEESEEESEEVGSSEVGSSGKTSLSAKVVLVFLAVEAGAVRRALGSCHQGVCRQDVCRQGGFRILPSRQVRVRVGQVWVRSVPYR